MARDYELDQLKSQMDSAFERMKSARDTMNASWERRSGILDQMNEAFENMNSTRNAMESAWEDLQSARNHQQQVWESMDHSNDGEYERLTNLIDEARSNADSAFENAQEAFRDASNAYENHDGAAAKSYSEDGHRYIDECHRYNDEFQSYVEERREVARRQKSAGSALSDAKANTDYYRSEHERLHAEFVSAKSEWQSLRDQYQSAKQENERDNAIYRSAKADFDQAHAAYIKRREYVQDQRRHEKDSDRELARKAGVPSRFLDNILVKRDSDGTVNIYYGGYGSPDGLGHGHCSIDPSGEVTYDRAPNEEHGAQNYKNHSHRRAVRKSQVGHTVNEAFNNPVERSRRMPAIATDRFNGDPAKVVNRKDSNVKDIYYGGSNPAGDGDNHGHVVVDENDSVVYWRGKYQNHNDWIINDQANKPDKNGKVRFNGDPIK